MSYYCTLMIEAFWSRLLHILNTTEWTYCVVVDGLSSRIIHIKCSVPQGSVLGPLLFILYTAELADIAAQYEITLHAFADDNQLYMFIACHNRRWRQRTKLNSVLRCLTSGWQQTGLN